MEVIIDLHSCFFIRNIRLHFCKWRNTKAQNIWQEWVFEKQRESWSW